MIDAVHWIGSEIVLYRNSNGVFKISLLIERNFESHCPFSETLCFLLNLCIVLNSFCVDLCRGA